MYHVKWSEPFLAEEATESSHQAQLCDCTAQVSAGRGPAAARPLPARPSLLPAASKMPPPSPEKAAPSPAPAPHSAREQNV